jgi:twitching motility protein PilT
VDITQLLAFSVKNKASDLHLSAGPAADDPGARRRAPHQRRALDHKQVHAMVYDIMNDSQRKHYEEFLESTSRSRSRAWRAFASTPSTRTAARRGVPDHSSKILTLEQLNAPRSSATWRSSRAAWCW